MHKHDIETRLIELETKFSYQDHTISELNDVITEQQQMIDGIQKRLKQIEQYIQHQSHQDVCKPDEDVPPPHY